LARPGAPLPAKDHVYLDDSGDVMSHNNSSAAEDSLLQQFNLIINLAQLMAETKAGLAAEALLQQKQRAKEQQMNAHRK
jgi:hypothetical protein